MMLKNAVVCYGDVLSTNRVDGAVEFEFRIAVNTQIALTFVAMFSDSFYFDRRIFTLNLKLLIRHIKMEQKSTNSQSKAFISMFFYFCYSIFLYRINLTMYLAIECLF